MLAISFLELNFKRLYRSSEKEKEVVVLCSRSPQKLHRRQRNVQKSVIRVQSSCFAYVNLVFLRSRCRRRFRC